MHRNIISIVKPTRYTNVSNLLHFGMTLHVLDGLSVHHQEFETVHTATGICQTDTAVRLLASRQQYISEHLKETNTIIQGTVETILSSMDKIPVF